VKPLDFMESLSSLSPAAQKRIMRDNAAELTATANV
jgi:hypothetical protein